MMNISVLECIIYGFVMYMLGMVVGIKVDKHRSRKELQKWCEDCVSEMTNGTEE